MAFRKILRSTGIIINLGFIIWLLLCKWVGYRDTEHHPSLFSLLSFTTIFAAIGNATFVFIWLFSHKKIRSLLSLITLLICWNVARPVLGFNYFGKNNVAPSDALGLKIMTWNVHLFDLGEWTQDQTSKARILKLIRDENPDILCMEEYYWDAKDQSSPYTDIIQQSGYSYVQLSAENGMKKTFITKNAGKNDIIYTGHAIFSKYPLRNPTRYPLLGRSYNMLGVEVVIDSNNIFNLNVVHLTSVGFGANELNYISEVKEKGMDAQNKDQSKSLLKKLIDASSSRALLANRIDSIKQTMHYPVIICGDFNDVPGSYVYNTVKGNLSDAFAKKGIGFGRTYRYIFPTLRIDYIFYDENALTIEGYERPNVPLSDHFPVIANFTLKNKKQ